MNEIKQQLIGLFVSRDVKRRKKLYQYYESYFKQQHSVRFTLLLINADLGSTLVTWLDIKYIRAHCHQWQTTQPDQTNTLQQLAESNTVEQSGSSG
ncbi:hypothetical protein [Dyadobacter sp. LHD-138]|uniref:hypothetical protein n=1 Tax=Dyadobacter sp. LHD-138 TaxID=3071413 RepID=UPI0027DFDCE6|nr:hypothetical protein [Dyadobacter sp. LHD-138]MDQ6481825.1 hypothetical protein [Dyadobacter sp. LHD-138]